MQRAFGGIYSSEFVSFMMFSACDKLLNSL